MSEELAVRESGKNRPSWVRGAGRGRAFSFGLLRALYVPGWILLVSASGFGVLAHDAGLSLSQAFLIMAVYFGLPAQVAVADQLARDASFLGGAIAVALTGIRLFPMTVTLMPFLTGQGEGTDVDSAASRAQDTPGSRVGRIVAVHFVAVTAWFEGMRALPDLPENLRVSHFIGIGVGLLCMTLVGTAAGFLLVEVVPPVVGGVLLFVSPMYFLLSLIDAAHLDADKLAILLGCGLSPVFYVLVPDFDLLFAGLFGGTIAYLFGRYRRGLAFVPVLGRSEALKRSRADREGGDG